MDIRKSAVGGAFWFAGILVPVLQHALLLLDAALASPHDVAVENFRLTSIRNFYQLPSIVWLYLAVMWGVGTVLVVSGFMTKAEVPRSRLDT